MGRRFRDGEESGGARAEKGGKVRGETLSNEELLRCCWSLRATSGPT